MGFIAAFTKEKCHFKTARQLKLELIQSEGLIRCRRRQLLCTVISITLSMIADALLCHDDELEGRRIAFILYLVPSWDRNLGGTLDLYDTDGKMTFTAFSSRS